MERFVNSRKGWDKNLKWIGALKYFTEIQSAKSQEGIFILQPKYTLNLLEEAGKTQTKKWKLEASEDNP